MSLLLPFIISHTKGTAAFAKQHNQRRLAQQKKVINLGPVVDEQGAQAPTVAPVPEPFFDGICFSGDTTVQTEHGVTVPMRDLEIGDRVLVDAVTSQYETVYAFAKRDATVFAGYLKLGWKQLNSATSMKGNRKLSGGLEISRRHMLAVSADNDSSEWKMIPAFKVEIGDKVQILGGSVAEITSIGAINSHGIYAPLTFSGKIVASNVQASTYVSIQNTEYLMLGSESETPVLLTHQWLAQAFLLPVRWIGSFTAALFDADVFAWLPRFFMAMEPAVLKLLQLPAAVLLPFVVPFVVCLSAASLLESALLLVWSFKLLTVPLLLVAMGSKSWRASGMAFRAAKKVV